MYSYDKEAATLLARPEAAAAIARTMDRIDDAIRNTGAITYEKALTLTGQQSDSFQMLAVLDYLVEHGFYYRLQGLTRAGQDQILLAKTR